MTVQPYPIIEIDASFKQLGEKTCEFHFVKSDVNEGIRTGPLTEGALSNLLGALRELNDGSTRKGISLSSGGGVHYVDISFESLGEQDGQWGYSDDPNTLDAATATGGDREQKANVWNNTLRHSSPDSLQPARLKWGEWAPNGVMPQDHLSVYLEDPEMRVPKSGSTSFEGDLMCLETADVDRLLHGQRRTE